MFGNRGGIRKKNKKDEKRIPGTLFCVCFFVVLNFFLIKKLKNKIFKKEEPIKFEFLNEIFILIDRPNHYNLIEIFMK